MEKREEEEEQKEEEEHSSLISSSDSMFMDPTNCDGWGNPERWLDIEVDFIKAEVQILQLKASFLKVLLSCGGKWHIENGNLEHLATRILVGFQNADLDLQRLWLDFFIWNPLGFFKRTSLEKSLIMANMYGLLSGIRERLKLLQPDIDDVYTVLSQSSGCDADMIYEATKAGRIQEELEKIQNCSRADECFDLRLGIVGFERRLLHLSERLEIQTCFKNDIEALFSGQLFVIYLSCQLDDGSVFNYRPRQMEGKTKMTDNAGPLEDETRSGNRGLINYFLRQMEEEKKITDKAEAFEDETRFENKLKMILPKLKWLMRSETNLMCPLRNEVEALLLKVSLLRVFPNSKGKWHTEDGSLKALLTRIRSVSQSLDAPLSSAHETLQLLKPDIQQVYNILSESSMFISVTSAKGVTRKLQESIWHLLSCNAELVAPVKEELEAVRKCLRFLRNFLNFTTKRCSKPEELRELLIHVEFRVVKISCLLYLCSDDNMMMSYVTVQLSSELQNFSSAQSREIYVKALKASKSEQGNSILVDESDLEFFDSLRDYVLKLSDTELGFMICNKNQILSLHEELRILTLAFATDESPGDQMFTNLLKHINAAIIDTGCVIYSLHNDAINRELKIAVSQLQDNIKIAKQDARKAYDMYLPNSLRPKFSRTNVQDFIALLLEISQFKIPRFEKECRYPLRMVQDEIRSLLEAFNQFTAEHPSHHEELQIQSAHFSDVEYLIRYVMTSFFYRRGAGNTAHWSHNLGFFNVIQEIRMLKMWLKDIQNKMARDTSAINVEKSKIEDQLKWQETLGLKSTEVASKSSRFNMYLPKSVCSIFPRINGQGFIGFLLRNLMELQSTELKLTGSLFQNAGQILVAPLKHQIEEALDELLSLREEFTKTTKHPRQFEEFQGQWTRFVGVAYQTEYVVDSFLSRGTCPLDHHKLELSDVIEEIKTIKIELEAKKNKRTSVQNPSCFPIRISLEANSPKNNAKPSFKERMAYEQTVSKLVIFGKEAEEIREKLTNRSKNLNFLSIVGMPGIGKTTLADSVLQHESIIHHFHVRARCSVSQVHDKKRMLREILQEVTGERKQYKDDDLEQKLKQSLLGRRYLIFLDDMWDARPWEDIRACFPNGNNGSWIMFTSRSDGIASQVASDNITYRLLPLSEEKSWEMLRVKVFGSESCPPELVSIGREIAANCKGLPLTVDLIAGILRATKWENWKEVTENMTRRLLTDDTQDQCWNVLELSYKDLPDELKPCFLYFAAFPEDAEVPTRKLFSLWIAEGFVQLQKNDLRCLEKVAEDILNDLIARSLVTISKSRALGGVKGTRVHDLLHEFALIKAQEENFVMIIDRKGKKAKWQEQYRLCSNDPFEEFNDSSRARTFICIELVECWMNFGAFKLLRVLDIPRANPEIFTLIHLRFLALYESEYNFLSGIHKLPNLETFILIISSGEDEYLLLDKVCNMVRLRHFKVGGNYFSFRYNKENILETSSLFDNLQTLCGLQLSYTEEIEKILKLVSNLVKLKVKFYNCDRKCYPFPKLDFLRKLESLNVTHDDFENPCKITSYPPYLRKLVLSKFQVPWTEISKMGNFEYLEVLKLKERAFVGPKWDMVDGQFPKLKCLSMDDLDIEEWNPFEDQLSCLEQLYVERCTRLKELPSCLAETLTLQVIKLNYCHESVVDSVERIKEEQEGIGNEISVVVIVGEHFSDSDEHFSDPDEHFRNWVHLSDSDEHFSNWDEHFSDSDRG